MWPFLILVAVATLLVLHYWWRRRYAMLQRDLARMRAEATALREQQTQALALQNAQQLALFDRMIEGVLILDADGRVRLVNRALKQFFQLTSDVRGRTLMEAFRRHELQELIDRVAKERQVMGFDLDLASLDKRSFQVNCALLADNERNSQGMILVFHDLTRLKKLENTRQEFVANVSHELRTPLSMIKGFVETLLNGAKDDPVHATRFLETIEKHANRLNDLIEDLLKISHLENGQAIMNLQPVDLPSLVDRVIEDLQSRAEEKRVSIENKIADGLVANVDPGYSQQILFNLVENAIRYGRSEGRVQIGAKVIDPAWIQLWVADNGPGIPPDAKERVFERFFRVDRARSRETGGTGLGLAIVKHIVQSHGGQVWVESEEGRGATFFLTLPRPQPSGEPPSGS